MKQWRNSNIISKTQLMAGVLHHALKLKMLALMFWTSILKWRQEKEFIAPQCKFNIAVQTLQVQQLTSKELLLSFMSCYTLNYPTQKISMLQQSMLLVSQLEWEWNKALVRSKWRNVGRRRTEQQRLNSQNSEHQMKEVRRKDSLDLLLHICLSYCKEWCLV
jgi:hypothetical protein